VKLQTPTTTPGAYTRPENIFCTGFAGSTCNKCAFNLNYVLNGNICTKFQNQPTDYFQSGPPPKLLRG